MAEFLTHLSNGSFGIATAFTGYLVLRCLTPPNQPTYNHGETTLRDTLATKPFFILTAIYRGLFFLHTIWQGLVCLNKSFAPTPDLAFPMNETYLTWNKLSATYFAIIWIGCYIRLQAYRQLGKKFTFELHEPDKLKKDGLYRYVQHPSYTGAVPAINGAAFWFIRCDGVLATVLPSVILEYQATLNWLLPTILLLFAVVMVPMRVFDEETMLRNKFGKEWEDWHKRTARFIPFLV